MKLEDLLALALGTPELVEAINSINIADGDPPLNAENVRAEALEAINFARHHKPEELALLENGLRALLHKLRGSGNAPDVAQRLIAELNNGTANKDIDAWATEAAVTMQRLLP